MSVEIHYHPDFSPSSLDSNQRKELNSELEFLAKHLPSPICKNGHLADIYPGSKNISVLPDKNSWRYKVSYLGIQIGCKDKVVIGEHEFYHGQIERLKLK